MGVAGHLCRQSIELLWLMTLLSAGNDDLNLNSGKKAIKPASFLSLLLLDLFHLQRFLKVVQEALLLHRQHRVQVDAEDGSAEDESGQFVVPALALKLLDSLQVLLLDQAHKIDFGLFQLAAAVVDLEAVLLLL